MKIAFYGSSLLSAYWNGAATYYRGLLRELARRGYRIRFFEPDAFDRQRHRDIDPPGWAEVVVYDPAEVDRVIARAAEADVVVKASGVGVHDDRLLEGVMRQARPGALKVFWDVDAPATLAALDAGREPLLARVLPGLDMVLTYGGGPPVVSDYTRAGARAVTPVYNGLDPATHFPVPADPRFAADLAFLGNRLPDREARVHAFFLQPAQHLPRRRFLLAGAGWDDLGLPPNVRRLGHVPTRDHNAFNSTPLAILNISRDSMAATGYSPATRVFEAAGAAACLITDAWTGVETFFAPGREILVVRDGGDLAECLATLTPERAARIGQAALARARRDHVYAQRGALVDRLLRQNAAAAQAAE